MAKIVKVVSLFNEQTATRANTAYNTTNYSIRWLYTSGNYDGTVEIYFEAVMSVTASYTAYAELYDGSSSVTGSEVSTTSTTPARVRSGNLASNLSNGSEYRIRIKSSSSSGTNTLYAARLIIIQTGTITKTETIIELGSNATGSNTSYADDANKGFFDFVSAEWDGTLTIYFEAFMSPANAAATAYAQLVANGGSAVSGSEVSLGGTTVDARRRSSAITLVDGTEYGAQGKTDNGSYVWRMRNARIIIVQTSMTKTCTYYPVRPTYFASADQVLTSKIYWDNDEWDVASKAVYFEATQVAWSGQTGYSAAYASSTNIGEVSTTSTSKAHNRSGSLTLTDNTEYDAHTYSSGAGAAATHNANFIVIVSAITGGGTTYYQTVSGGITPAGALVKQTNRALTGGITPAGTLIKQTLRTLVGALTSSSTLSKLTSRVISGSLGTSGLLAKQTTYARSLAGTLSSSGSLSKLTSRSLSGLLSSAGNLTKQTFRLLAGTMTSSSTLTTIKVFLRSVGGTLGFSGDVTKQTNKILDGFLLPVGDTVKRISRSLSGTLSLSGALTASRTFLVTLAGTLSSSGTLVKQTARALSGVMPSAGSVIKSVQRTLSGNLGFAGSLVSQVITTSTRIYEVVFAFASRLIGFVMANRVTFETFTAGQVSVTSIGANTLNTVNERTTSYLTVTFKDKTGSPVTPASATWRVIDLKSQTEVMPETAIVALSSSVELTVPEASNAMVDSTNPREFRRAIVVAIHAGSEKVVGTYDWTVINVQKI